MKTTYVNGRAASDCPSCLAGIKSGCHAEQCGSTGRVKSQRYSKSTRSMRIGLLAVLFVCLIILSSLQFSECRRAGRRRKNRGSPGGKSSENEIEVQEPGSKAGSRRRNRNKAGRVLKTSEEARVITEKRYLVDDWCNKRPFKQLVRTKNGCKGYFLNNFCYGQCNSFYIPRELTPEAKGQEAFKSCAFCKPYKVDRVSVTLTCSRRRGKKPKTIERLVNKITECRCIAVPDIDSRTPAPEPPLELEATSSSATSGTTSSVAKR